MNTTNTMFWSKHFNNSFYSFYSFLFLIAMFALVVLFTRSTFERFHSYNEYKLYPNEMIRDAPSVFTLPARTVSDVYLWNRYVVM